MEPKRFIISMLVIAAGLGGCAGEAERISLEYVPFAHERGLEPNAMKVMVDAEDMRSAVGTKVSAGVNQVGFETHAIENDTPVYVFVESAISAEIEERGFQMEQGGAQVVIHVERFYNNFQRGADQSTAISQVGFRVFVKAPSGETVFSEYYAGGANRPVRLTNAANAKSALELAFYDAASRLAKDWRFFGAIVDANNE